MLKLPPSLPSLEAILSDNPGWLEEAIDTKAASKLTGVPVQTLETWRSRGGGPRFVKLGSKTVRYSRRELLSWMRSKVCASTADADSVIREGVRAIVIAAALLCVRPCRKYRAGVSNAYGHAGASPSAPQVHRV